MSAALSAAVRDAGDRLDAYRRFAERSLELLNAGITPPRAGEDAKLYRQLAISALRLLTKFPRALIVLPALPAAVRNAREPLMLPERAGGLTLGQLGLNLPEDP